MKDYLFSRFRKSANLLVFSIILCVFILAFFLVPISVRADTEDDYPEDFVIGTIFRELTTEESLYFLASDYSLRLASNNKYYYVLDSLYSTAKQNKWNWEIYIDKESDGCLSVKDYDERYNYITVIPNSEDYETTEEPTTEEPVTTEEATTEDMSDVEVHNFVTSADAEGGVSDNKMMIKVYNLILLVLVFLILQFLFGEAKAFFNKLKL